MTKTRHRTRKITTPRQTATALWMVAAVLWPQAAMAAGGQDAEGATLTLPSMPDGPIESWCGVDAQSLGACVGQFDCGEFRIPCGPTGGGLMIEAKGVGMRNTDTGTIGFYDVPAGAFPVVALAFWGLITDTPLSPVSQKLIFEGHSFMGERLGETAEPCWEASGSSAIFEAYYADVTSMLQPQINGDYSVVLPGSSVVDRSNPFDVPPGTPLLFGANRYVAQGVSLVLLYGHPRYTLDSRVEFHTQPKFLADSDIFEYSLSQPAPAADQVLSLRIGGDGQSRTRNGAVAGFRTSINLGSGWVVLRGDGSAIDINADWQGADGNFWDTQITTAAASALDYQAGISSLRVEFEAIQPVPTTPFNCVNSVVHGVVFSSLAQQQ